MLSKRTLIALTAIMTMSATVLLAQDGSDVIVKKQEGINFLSLLFKGGWFMVPLGLLSIAVVTISIERFIMLRRERLFPEELVTHIGMLAQAPGGLDPREAYKLCQLHPSAASKIIRNTLVKVGRPHSEVENALKESAQREATRLSQLASWLSLAAAVAPLIGLLGTVWGITQAFYDTTNLPVGEDRAAALGVGIYTALVTTMGGLLIAIPSAIVSHYFETKIVNTINDVEEMVSSLLPQLERYEGQIRFSENGTTTPLKSDRGNNADAGKRRPKLVVPEPETRPKR